MAKIDKYKLFRSIGIGLLLIGAALCVVGFILPPQGEIDPSVLKAFGEMLGGTGILMCWSCVEMAIEKGIDTKVTHRDMQIELNNPDKKEESK